MRTTLTARHVELTEALRRRIERKLGRLERVTHEDAEIRVELIGGASHAADEAHVVEVTVLSNGTLVRSTAPGATPLAAIDAVIDKVERQIVRSKQRPRRVRERAADDVGGVLERAAAGPGDAASTGSGTDTSGPSVVKTKRFDLAPMFEEDAIAQMDELGHAFFVFLNAETERVNIVYRRGDGNYGLMDPVVGRGGARR